MVEAFLSYISSPRLYIWRKEPRKPEHDASKQKSEAPGIYIPPLSESNLKELAWSLDIKDRETNRTRPTEKGHVPLLKDL